MEDRQLSSTRARRVFVVAPGSIDSAQEAKRAIIGALCRTLNCVAEFDEYDPLAPAFDLGEMRGRLQACQLAIVDLSHERPSCYFELGVIEAIGVPAFVLAKQGTPIHQTSYSRQVSFFSTMEQYRELVSQALARITDDRYQKPQSDIAAPR